MHIYLKDMADSIELVMSNRSLSISYNLYERVFKFILLVFFYHTDHL